MDQSDLDYERKAKEDSVKNIARVKEKTRTASGKVIAGVGLYCLLKFARKTYPIMKRIQIQRRDLL